MLAPLNPFLFTAAYGRTADLIAVRGSVRIRSARPGSRPKPPTDRQRAVRQAYINADATWRWLGLPRRMQWRIANKSPLISGYEAFMRANIRIFQYWSWPLLSPPVHGGFSPPSAPTYLAEGWAVYPDSTPAQTDKHRGIQAAWTATAASEAAAKTAVLEAYTNGTAVVTPFDSGIPHVHIDCHPTNGAWIAHITVKYVQHIYILPTFETLADENHYTTGWLDSHWAADPGTPAAGQGAPINLNGIIHQVEHTAQQIWLPTDTLFAPAMSACVPAPVLPIATWLPLVTVEAPFDLYNIAFWLSDESQPAHLSHWTPCGDHVAYPPVVSWRDNTLFTPAALRDAGALKSNPAGKITAWNTLGWTYYEPEPPKEIPEARIFPAVPGEIGFPARFADTIVEAAVRIARESQDRVPIYRRWLRLPGVVIYPELPPPG